MMTDLVVFESDGRISEEAADLLPDGLFVRAPDTAGWKAATLYRTDSLDHGLCLKAVFVDVECDEFTVTFMREEPPKIEVAGMTYIQPETHVLQSIIDLDDQAQAIFESGDRFYADWDKLLDLEMTEPVDEIAFQRHRKMMLRTYKSRLDKWRKVR